MHWSNQIIGPGILLVGDAAHNVTPQMGQGCNSALEDIRVLDEMLAQEGQGVNDAEGVQRVLQKFQQKRLPQVSDVNLCAAVSCATLTSYCVQLPE